MLSNVISDSTWTGRISRVHTIHAARDLARLLIAPADRREIRLVVHEARVEERLHVRVRRLDVDLAARRRVLEVLEHRDVLARGQDRVVRVRPADDRAEHDGLVRLVLEVAVPERVELGAHLLELRLGGADLEPGVDRVRGEARFLGARLPFRKELLLCVFVAAQEVVECLRLVRYAVD